jgi:hypothetical protein
MEVLARVRRAAGDAAIAETLQALGQSEGCEGCASRDDEGRREDAALGAAEFGFQRGSSDGARREEERGENEDERVLRCAQDDRGWVTVAANATDTTFLSR